MNSCSPSTSSKRRAERLLMAVVVASGAATVFGFGGRLGWLLELSSHFRVQYFWLLTVGAIGLALLKRVRWTLTAAALATVNLALIVPLYFGPAPSVSAGAITRAMSLNLNWQNREHERALELIRLERPDFLVLIEVTPPWADALRVLESEYPYSHCLPREDSSGIALYSRIPIRDLRVKDVGGVDLPTIIAELDVAGGPLTLIASHPASPTSPMNFGFRNRQLAGLARLARQQPGAVMLLGDLNTTSWSPYFQDLLSDSGLADSRRGFGVLGSWPALWRPLRIPIDHCLVSADVAVADRRIGPAVGSDHRAVLVDFVVLGH